MVPDKATPEEIQELANTFVGELLEDFKAIVRRRQLMDVHPEEEQADEQEHPGEDEQAEDGDTEDGDAAEDPPAAEG